MTSTSHPTNVQSPLGSRFETYSKQQVCEPCGPCGPCPPSMMTPYNNYYGGYPTSTPYGYPTGPWTTGPWNYSPMPWTQHQMTPYCYPGSYPQWCGPEQHQHQQQQHQHQHQHQHHSQTYCNVPFRPSNQTEFHCLTNPIRVLDREGNRCIWLCYDVRGFKPEECNVTLNKNERSITLECNQECKDGKEHHVQRKYYRKYCFPESMKCDLSKCEPRCYINQEGQMTIECQLPKMTPEEITRCPQITCPTGPYGCPPTNCYTPVNCKTC